MLDEMKILQTSGTFDLVSLSIGKLLVGCRWAFIVKVGLDGKIDRLKARLVAKGYSKILA